MSGMIVSSEAHAGVTMEKLVEADVREIADHGRFDGFAGAAWGVELNAFFRSSSMARASPCMATRRRSRRPCRPLQALSAQLAAHRMPGLRGAGGAEGVVEVSLKRPVYLRKILRTTDALPCEASSSW
ncbi:hypothetical protein J7E62_25500 [Variovorax paradoxus]|nr:hypothetical protein [Variovorax paradoxus]